MDFDRMNAIQRRLHNAACVLGADGDEYGFEQLQRDAIAEIDRLHADADRAKGLIRRLATEARQSGDLLRDPEALALAAMYYGA